jgi:hypothetical protein
MLISKELRNTLRALHGMIGSTFDNESDTATKKLKAALAENGLSWNDLDEILHDDVEAAPADDGGDPFRDVEPGNGPPPAQSAPVTPAPLELIDNLLRRYLFLTDAELTALALWIAHTFTYRNFSVTPRLALLSPTNGCGKSTVFAVIEKLAMNASKIDNASAAILFRLIDKNQSCILLDEADNSDLPINSVMRAVINSGHRDDGKTARFIKGEVKMFSTFAPMGIAAIGSLPAPMLRRSIVLSMKRAPAAAGLERFDPKTNEGQARMLQTVFGVTTSWALGSAASLDLDPPMPMELRNRQGDNWRPLLSIADNCSPEWGRKARAAAIELSQSRGDDEDAAVILLAGIREIWPSKADRMMSADLVEKLCDLATGFWSEWRGPSSDRVPHKLTMGQLALMLGLFGIKSKTLWPSGPRGPHVRSAKGYLRSQFVEAWASYCDDEPARPKHLHAV